MNYNFIGGLDASAQLAALYNSNFDYMQEFSNKVSGAIDFSKIIANAEIIRSMELERISALGALREPSVFDQLESAFDTTNWYDDLIIGSTVDNQSYLAEALAAQEQNLYDAIVQSTNALTSQMIDELRGVTSAQFNNLSSQIVGVLRSVEGTSEGVEARRTLERDVPQVAEWLVETEQEKLTEPVEDAEESVESQVVPQDDEKPSPSTKTHGERVQKFVYDVSVEVVSKLIFALIAWGYGAVQEIDITWFLEKWELFMEQFEPTE